MSEFIMNLVGLGLFVCLTAGFWADVLGFFNNMYKEMNK